MATLLFVLLRSSRVIDGAYDSYFLCLLVALELPAYWRLALYWRANR